MSPRRVAVALLLAAASLAPSAGAVKYRRPFTPALGVKYGMDHDGSKTNGSCKSFDCDGTCYDGHKGSDFPLPLGTDVLAAADGVATTVVQGCADYGGLGNTCGGGFGNYVKLTHSDGRATYYGHMKNGSIVVSQGATVKCGQKLGQSASSGSSTGPHLHFEPRDGGTVSTDPFAGGCSQASSLWVKQTGKLPGDQCEPQCACTPGQTQDQPCGNCGVQHRACSSACQWDAWGACGGEGACAPGATEASACPCGGDRSRACTPACQWGAFGECPACPEAGSAGAGGTGGAGGASGASGGAASAAGGGGTGGAPASAGASGSAGAAPGGAGGASGAKGGQAGRAGAPPAGAGGRAGHQTFSLDTPESTEQGACSCSGP
ncbi:MAG: M23 family metallopeptidase, partial [Polyangiaceae bacterium]|nr:M23 family metallopeptidase [Polyangiaceae bacterium]